MNKDRWITVGLIVGIGVVIFVATTSVFVSFATSLPLVASFTKFFVLASIGDVIGLRLQQKRWGVPPKFLHKAIIWGIIGVVIYFMFIIYPSGVSRLQESGILPFKDSILAMAFFTSLMMNYTFAPTMMAVHRITDSYLNHRSSGDNQSLIGIINTIDWGQFFHFTLFRTIPLFWIPAHTITFLLPVEFRIIFAAMLGIVLGILLRFTNKSK